jgi:glutamate racemase
MGSEYPIGVFDSGLGGLTVVSAIQKLLPDESIIYFGDTARVPYGNKSIDLIREYSLEISDYLLTQKTKLLVVACNTASALALTTLKEHLDIPVIGVIEPGVRAALTATKNNRVGVIGTISTIQSNVYQKELENRYERISVFGQACPLFVPLVEEGWLDDDITGRVANIYLKDLNAQDIDTLILGCTHYPLLKSILQATVLPGTTLVDSAEVVAEEISSIIDDLNLRTSAKDTGTLSCFVTDLPARFETVAKRFLGDSIAHVSKIHL